MRIFSSLLCLAMLLGAATAQGQYGFHFGFRAGLNFNKLDAPSEQGADGKDLEAFKGGTGFHVGLTTRVGITENFGVAADLIYTQKGGKQSFEGPGYFIFQTGDQPKYGMGDKKVSLNLTNGYIDLPLTLYYKPTKWLELHAGAQVGLLVASRATGEINYSGLNPVSAPIAVSLDYNFRKDGAYSPSAYQDVEKIPINVDGRLIEVPRILEAYYFYAEKPADLYNTFDLGLIGGVNLYISQSLFLGFRYNFGLRDVTNNDADVSQSLLNNNQLVPRADEDRNRSMQISVGFIF